MKRNLSENEVLKKMKYGCNCRNTCLNSFKLGEMKTAISLYGHKNHKEKTRWLLNLFEMFYNPDTDKLHLRIRGVTVCPGAFCSFYGITEYKFYVCLNMVKKNNFIVIHGNSSREYRQYQSDLCSTYLEVYLTTFGEQQPDSDEVHLPHTCIKIDLYDLFKLQCTENIVPHISTFLKVWKEKFP